MFKKIESLGGFREKTGQEAGGKEKKEDRFEESPDLAVNRFFIDFTSRYREHIESGNIGIVINDLDSEIRRLIASPDVRKRGKEFAVIVAREVLACMGVYFFAYKDFKKGLLDVKKDSDAKQGIKQYLMDFIESGGEVGSE
jgi:hypothetical protein